MKTDTRPTKRRKRKRGKRKKAGVTKNPYVDFSAPSGSSTALSSAAADALEVEYVKGTVDVDASDPVFGEMADVLARFAAREEEEAGGVGGTAAGEGGAAGEEDGAAVKVEEVEEEEEEAQPLSKKKRKKMSRLTVSQLKRLVRNPEIVGTHDVNGPDPLLLVHLKAMRNTVQVPRHWSQKRKYLQNKRGIEKAPFRLPDFIAATGISKMRDALSELDDEKKQKQKQRERVTGKMGKVDIDYQVLHDAFFKYQTKPKLTEHGDLYFEGRENEVCVENLRPGNISGELKEALGMVPGAPPPYLLAMQRFGPPPSYPNLKIPGLNAPLPPHASYGFAPGQWGHVPVDEFGNPLYGDAFGQEEEAQVDDEFLVPEERMPWGIMAEEEDEEEDEEEGEGEEGEGVGEGGADDTLVPPGAMDADDDIPPPPPPDEDMAETAEHVSLRKAPKQLYQVLEQKDTSVGGATFGSAHTYVVPGGEASGGGGGGSAAASGVAVSINPSELEELGQLDEAMIKKKFQQEQEKASAARAAQREGVDAEMERHKRKQRSSKAKKFKF